MKALGKTCGLVLAFAALASSARAELAPETQALCAKAKAVSVPSEDVACTSQKPLFKECDSPILYYGIGVAQDYESARKCAYMERERADAKPMGGSGMLMMIYANGLGVEKNYDLALKFACEAGGAEAEVEHRVDHLVQLKEEVPLTNCEDNKALFSEEYCAGKIDMCDDITSGHMQGVCAAKDSAIAEAKNEADLRALTVAWPVDHRQQFERLKRLADRYFDNHAENEIDLSGSARAAFQIEEKDAMLEKFRETLRHFETKLPTYSSLDFKRADKEMQTAYKTQLRKLATIQRGTTVKLDNVMRTQKLWLAYRDAWVAFAKLHFPEASAESIKTYVTLERIGTIWNIAA
jgi:uncharacterized protein YecT (DUF1311 family)